MKDSAFDQSRDASSSRPASHGRSGADGGAPGLHARLLALQSRVGNRAFASALAAVPADRQPPGSLSLQRASRMVGFRRMNDGALDDVLATSSLANCIAVVAYEPVTPRAVMAHYDSFGLFPSGLGSADDMDVAQLRRLKQQLDDILLVGSLSKDEEKNTKARNAAAGIGGTVRYHIGLGTVWDPKGSFMADEEPRLRSREALLRGLEAIFARPTITQTGNTATFNIATGELTGSKVIDPAEQFGKGWATSGEQLDHDALRRRPRTAVRSGRSH